VACDGPSLEFQALEQDEVKKPNLVNLAEIDFLRIQFDEGENIFLAEAVHVVPAAGSCDVPGGGSCWAVTAFEDCDRQRPCVAFSGGRGHP